VLGGWDEVGLAASNAIKKANRTDVFSVSIDGNLGTFDAIRAGEPMGATCANDMTTITSVCLDQLSKMVSGGKPLGETIYVDAPFISKHNVPPQGQFPVGAGLTPFYTAA
jgi:ABC-type sugar transport system substrate-binding protein